MAETLAPEDRCTLSADCDRPFQTTIVGWAGGTGWVFDACWPCARRVVDEMGGWRLEAHDGKPHGEEGRWRERTSRADVRQP